MHAEPPTEPSCAGFVEFSRRSVASRAQDDSRIWRDIQTSILMALRTRTNIYPEFAETDWSGEVPVVTAVRLTWDQFLALATPHLEP